MAINSFQSCILTGMTPRPQNDAFAANVRRLRGSATLDQVATAARRLGAKWTTGRVANLECGRAAPTLENLVMAAAAIGMVHNQPIKLSELVDEEFAPFLSGEPVVLPATQEAGPTDQEARIAKSLGMSLETLVEMSHRLWGRTFVEERDTRCLNASAQKRGHITRAMMNEIRREATL